MPSFEDMLKKEIALVGQFLDVLKAEHESLKQGDADGLSSLTAKKMDLVSAIDSADAERNAYLKSQGFAPDRQGAESFVASRTQPEAKALWQALLAQAEEAKALNLISGQLIAMRLQANSQALDAITHHSPKSRLYGPDGQTSGFGGGRIIESA